MKKKLLSLFVTCCLILSFLSLPTLEGRADEEQQFGAIYVGDVEMDSRNGTVYATTDAKGTVTIQKTYKENDPWNVKYSGNTLVLKNATITGNELRNFSGTPIKAGLMLCSDESHDKEIDDVPTIHLQLEGDNLITTSDGEQITINSGISALNLEISGNGALTVATGTGVISTGIYLLGNLTINNGEINYNGGNSSNLSSGIYSEGLGTFVMNGGRVTVVGGSYGIFGNNMKTILSGGSLTAMGEGKNGQAFWMPDPESKYKTPVMISPFTGTSMVAVAGSSEKNAQPLEGSPFFSETDITSQIRNVAYFHSHVNVTGVTISPASAAVQKGQTKQFAAATMSGQVQVDTDVTWKVEGVSVSDTSISEEGLLTVSEKETAKTLTVRAISNIDTTKSGTAVVTVTEASNEGTDTSNPSADQVGTVLKDTATKNTYKVTGNGTVEYLGNTAKKKKVVEIPTTVESKGVRYTVTAIANNAFKNNKKLTKIVIGKNVTKIGKKAFYGCKNLKKITIKSTKLKKKNIGAKAFAKAGSKNYSKLKVIVPKKCLKSYKKLLKQKGLSSKATIKK